MKETTPLNIRVAVPVYKEQVREPFATLTYGNITIEIDKTVIGFLGLNSNSNHMAAVLFSNAIDQIQTEMHLDETGRYSAFHRDNPQNKFWNDLRNPLHSQRQKDYYTQIEREDD